MNRLMLLGAVLNAAQTDVEAEQWLRGEGEIVLYQLKDGGVGSRFEHHNDARAGRRADAWRTFVFERDEYTCQECGQVGGKLQAHHLASWAEKPDKRFDRDNGVTLCVECHASRHPRHSNFIRAARYFDG